MGYGRGDGVADAVGSGGRGGKRRPDSGYLHPLVVGTLLVAVLIGLTMDLYSVLFDTMQSGMPLMGGMGFGNAQHGSREGVQTHTYGHGSATLSAEQWERVHRLTEEAVRAELAELRDQLEASGDLWSKTVAREKSLGDDMGRLQQELESVNRNLDQMDHRLRHALQQLSESSQGTSTTGAVLATVLEQHKQLQGAHSRLQSHTDAVREDMIRQSRELGEAAGSEQTLRSALNEVRGAAVHLAERVALLHNQTSEVGHAVHRLDEETSAYVMPHLRSLLTREQAEELVENTVQQALLQVQDLQNTNAPVIEGRLRKQVEQRLQELVDQFSPSVCPDSAADGGVHASDPGAPEDDDDAERSSMDKPQRQDSTRKGRGARQETESQANPASSPALTVAEVEKRLQNCLSVEEAKRLIDQELDLYAADRIGKTDFALRAAGAVVEKRMTSKSYTPPGQIVQSDQFHYFNVEAAYGPPEDAISHDTTIGRCWAMDGHSGQLTVRLATPIIVTSVTLEHVSSKVSLDMSSAPRDFEILGYRNEEAEPVHLGAFQYEYTSLRPHQVIQEFPIPDEYARRLSLITLKINSNYGGDYTCIYRFRVHGEDDHE